jgi:hypothetical protein
MNSNPLPFWCVYALLSASLWASGCSSDQPQLPAAAMATSSVTEMPVVPQPAAVIEAPVQPVTPVEQVPANALSWDVTEQRRAVHDSDQPVMFRFQMKNVSQAPVLIENVSTSCGCTTTETRAVPFSLAPGDSELIQVSMNVNGKSGTVTKSLLVQGSHASWILLVTVELPPPADIDPVAGVSKGVAMSARSRGKNIGLAKADRQAVFKGDCARCHTHYAEEQFGHDLYLGACAICHDAEHRASMVPDLRVVDESRDAAYWRLHISDGIEDTLMPAFATEKGGILSDEQIESLVKFLVETPLEPMALMR